MATGTAGGIVTSIAGSSSGRSSGLDSIATTSIATTSIATDRGSFSVSASDGGA
jgi:hypothetical protein